MATNEKHSGLPPEIFTCEVIAQIIDYVPHALIQLYLCGNYTIQKTLVQHISSWRFKDKRILSLGIIPRFTFDLENLRCLSICLLSSAPVVIDEKPYPLIESLLLIVRQLDEFALKCYALRRNRIPKDEDSTDMGELICLAKACNREMRSFKFSAIEFYNEYGEDFYSELGRSSLWPKFAQSLPRSLHTLSVNINMGGAYIAQDYDFGSWFELLPSSLTYLNVPSMLLNHNHNKSLDVWPASLIGLKNGQNLPIDPIYYTFRASEGFFMPRHLRLVLWLKNENIYNETRQILSQRHFTHFEVRCATDLYTPSNLTSLLPSSTRAISLHLLNERLVEGNRNSFDIWKHVQTSHDWASKLHWPKSLTWLKIESTLSVHHLIEWLSVDNLIAQLESLDVRLGVSNKINYGQAQSFAGLLSTAHKLRELRIVFEDLIPTHQGWTYIPRMADYLLVSGFFMINNKLKQYQPPHLTKLHLDIYLKEEFCDKFIHQGGTHERDSQNIEALLTSLSSTLQNLEISIWSDVLATFSINLSWICVLSCLKELRSFKFYICTESRLKNLSIDVSRLPSKLKNLSFKIVTRGRNRDDINLVEWKNLARWYCIDLKSFTYELYHDPYLSTYICSDVSELATSLPKSLRHLIMFGMYISSSRLKHLPTQLKTFNVPVKDGKQIVLPTIESVPFLKTVQKLGVDNVYPVQHRHFQNMLILRKYPNLHQIENHYNVSLLKAGHFESNTIPKGRYGWLTLSERRHVLDYTLQLSLRDYLLIPLVIITIIGTLVIYLYLYHHENLFES